MRLLNYRELRRRYELDGPAKTVEHLSEALTDQSLRPDDFSLRDLAEALIPEGREWVRTLDPRSGGVTPVLESSEGLDASAFQNVTAQVIHAKIQEAYTQPAFVASRLVDTIPTRLDGEKIPGVTRVADQVDEVSAGMPFPSLGFDEDYIETPATSKHGFIVPVTKEAIFFDRTNLIFSRAAEVGEVLGLNKEKRLLDLIVGVTNNYKHKGIEYDTYQTSGPWVNVLESNELVDWTSVDAAEQLFADMLDPATGEPVLLRGTTALVMPAYRHAAHRTFNASEISYAPTGGETATLVANPLGSYGVEESRLAYRRVLASGETTDDAKKWWFLGDFKRAFAYMENWPITVTQAPLGSEADFSSDIALRFKASERGAAAVINPRYVVKCTG